MPVALLYILSYGTFRVSDNLYLKVIIMCTGVFILMRFARNVRRCTRRSFDETVSGQVSMCAIVSKWEVQWRHIGVSN